MANLNKCPVTSIEIVAIGSKELKKYEQANTNYSKSHKVKSSNSSNASDTDQLYNIDEFN